MSDLVYVGPVESMAVRIRQIQQLAGIYNLRLARVINRDGTQVGSARCLHFKIVVKKGGNRQQFLKEALKIPYIRDKCTMCKR